MLKNHLKLSLRNLWKNRLLSMLNLLGLSIGIRKVLGAEVLKIVVLLSKDYIILVGIATLIAFPAAWYMMNAWLSSFAYSITIQWWMFALGGLIALLITSFTLGIQAVKSASTNPVKSLRTE